MDKCELCRKSIKFVGIIWFPPYGPLKDFCLYFDTADCAKKYKEQYAKYMEEHVGYESQNTNIKEELERVGTADVGGTEASSDLPPGQKETESHGSDKEIS